MKDFFAIARVLLPSYSMQITEDCIFQQAGTTRTGRRTLHDPFCHHPQWQVYSLRASRGNGSNWQEVEVIFEGRWGSQFS